MLDRPASAVRDLARYALTPILLALYPSVFLYHENAAILTLGSLALPLAVSLAATLVCYLASYFIFRRNSLNACNACLAFMPFFFLYGATYGMLLKLDVIEVFHQTLLPVIGVMAGYAAWFATRLGATSANSLEKGTRFLLCVLVAYNVLGIAGMEFGKLAAANASAHEAITGQDGTLAGRRPDIYYILLDEYAGFDAIRAYWNYEEIGKFERFLEMNGFFVANGSRSATANTLVEMSSRLNFQRYDPGLETLFYYQNMAHNRVMVEMKALGYTTVVLDSLGGPFGMPGRPPIVADFGFQYNRTAGGLEGLRPDEFARMVFDVTALRAVTDGQRGRTDPLVSELGDYLLLTFDRLSDLEGIPSPRFVYAHIMLPHMPFIFDENGRRNDDARLWDYHYYLGTYIFATSKLTELVGRLLASANPGSQPIIVLQSDHGARNIAYKGSQTGVLEDYPEEYAHYILNALFLPGIDLSQLPEDTDPINTFPLILNYYFGYHIPLQ